MFIKKTVYMFFRSDFVISGITYEVPWVMCCKKKV